MSNEEKTKWESKLKMLKEDDRVGLDGEALKRLGRMKLEAKSETGKILFRDFDSKEVVYPLLEQGRPDHKSREEIVKEFLLICEVMIADVESSAGWAPSVNEKLKQRLHELRFALMNLCIKELEK